jgi:hypothetical protein
MDVIVKMIKSVSGFAIYKNGNPTPGAFHSCFGNTVHLR